MKRFLLILLVQLPAWLGYAQPEKYYRSLDEALTNPTEVYNLELRALGLTTVPEIISKFINLQRLDLSNNELTDISPSTFLALKSLHRLDLTDNKLSRLPDVVTKMTNLVSLNVSRNQLTFLPASIGNLQNLRFLTLEENQLTALRHRSPRS